MYISLPTNADRPALSSSCNLNPWKLHTGGFWTSFLVCSADLGRLKFFVPRISRRAPFMEDPVASLQNLRDSHDSKHSKNFAPRCNFEESCVSLRVRGWEREEGVICTPVLVPEVPRFLRSTDSVIEIRSNDPRIPSLDTKFINSRIFENLYGFDGAPPTYAKNATLSPRWAEKSRSMSTNRILYRIEVIQKTYFFTLREICKKSVNAISQMDILFCIRVNKLNTNYGA